MISNQCNFYSVFVRRKFNSMSVVLIILCTIFISSNFHCAKALETITRHEDESLPETWNKRAQQTLSEQVMLSMTPLVDKANSGILFVGSGMSVDTLTAARFWQSKEIEQETPLYFDTFPVVGMAKTYCVDGQVGEAACTATAYLSGMKSRVGIIGAAPEGSTMRCGIPDELDKTRIGSIAEWAIAAGKSVGIVTTSSVTHAGVAGSYGRSTRATWHNDYDVMKDGYDPYECSDLAVQLLQNDPGNKFKVILGGGRQHFLPNSTLGGERVDNNNLITDWMNERINMKQKHRYVGSRKELLDIDPNEEYLLGLFSLDHFKYHMFADEDQPTLEEMAEAAIKVLSKNENGYFLFVFGGRIGDAHDENKAILALDETLELSKAVKRASTMSDQENTLMIVTANHAHTLKFAGYGSRWNSFFETLHDPKNSVDDLKYLSLTYANGPGYRDHVNGRRPTPQDETGFKEQNPSFQFLAQFPLDIGTSGGDDVAIFARGPSQRLFTGVMEQHLLPHLMAYSMCIGQGITSCDEDILEPLVEESESSSVSICSSSLAILLPAILSFLSTNQL